MRNKAIRKLTVEVFCFASYVQDVRESLGDWFGECDAKLYGGPPHVSKPTPEEEAKARPELEDMS